MVRRAPLWPDYDEWIAVEDARGQWAVVRESDEREPLRDPCPYERMVAAHLASRAPAMRAFCNALIPRLERTGWAQTDRRYRHLLEFGIAASGLYVPQATLARVLRVAGVLELPLDPSGDDEKVA